MIKEFFAKLVSSWDLRPRPEMRAAERLQEINAREKMLAKEREEWNRQRMQSERVIPEIKTNRPTDSSENHDQPAA